MTLGQPPFGEIKDSTDLERPHKRLGTSWAVDSTVNKIVTYEGVVVIKDGVVVTK